jgi:hypothetical protein
LGLFQSTFVGYDVLANPDESDAESEAGAKPQIPEQGAQ